MKGKEVSGSKILDIIGHLESDLSRLKRGISENQALGRRKEDVKISSRI